MDFKERAKEISKDIILWRRELHQIPELDLELTKTSQYIQQVLKQMGIDYETYSNHSGIVVVLGNPKGKVIALRADMDGLPIKEENVFEYASTNGNMHACGHDAHMAILLGTIKIIKENEHLLNGQVKFIFQPGEENLLGAKLMVEQGVLENPKVDALLTLHVGSLGGKENNGGIIVGQRNVFAASRLMEIKIVGKGGHASTPQLAVDPIVIGAEIIQSIQQIVSREVKPGTPAVVAITNFKSGHDTYNIIPDTAELMGGIRTADLETWEYITKRVEEVVSGIASVKNARGLFTAFQGTPPVINDKLITQKFLESAHKILPAAEIHDMENMNMGGEDAAYYFVRVPGCYFFINNPKMAADGEIYPHHNSKFDLDDSIIYIGTALFCQATFDFLKE